MLIFIHEKQCTFLALPAPLRGGNLQTTTRRRRLNDGLGCLLIFLQECVGTARGILQEEVVVSQRASRPSFFNSLLLLLLLLLVLQWLLAFHCQSITYSKCTFINSLLEVW